MKIELGRIRPNPFRDMDEYPVRREKVETLKVSFEQTGVWSGLEGRPCKDSHLLYDHTEHIMYWSGAEMLSDEYALKSAYETEYPEVVLNVDKDADEEYLNAEGNIELAFGHHRLIAMREMFDDDFLVEVAVRDRSDGEMLKMMADENHDIFGMTPIELNYTIKATRDFLNELMANSENYEAFNVRAATHVNIFVSDRQFLQCKQDGGIGYRTIHKFLNPDNKGNGWTENKIRTGLNSLSKIESNIVSSEAIRTLPSIEHQNIFVSEVSKSVKNGNPMPLKEQEELATQLADESIGRRNVRLNFAMRGYGDVEKAQPSTERKLPLPEDGEVELFDDIRAEDIKNPLDLDKILKESGSLVSKLNIRLDVMKEVFDRSIESLDYDRTLSSSLVFRLTSLKERLDELMERLNVVEDEYK